MNNVEGHASNIKTSFGEKRCTIIKKMENNSNVGHESKLCLQTQLAFKYRFPPYLHVQQLGIGVKPYTQDIRA